MLLGSRRKSNREVRGAKGGMVHGGSWEGVAVKADEEEKEEEKLHKEDEKRGSMTRRERGMMRTTRIWSVPVAPVCDTSMKSMSYKMRGISDTKGGICQTHRWCMQISLGIPATERHTFAKV